MAEDEESGLRTPVRKRKHASTDISPDKSYAQGQRKGPASGVESCSSSEEARESGLAKHSGRDPHVTAAIAPEHPTSIPQEEQDE
jgi:hypothetical protein